MKISLTFLLILIISASFQVNAQTIFWTEGFGTGCTQLNPALGTITGNGTWSVTSIVPPAANANMWYISATEAGLGIGNCGSGCLTNAALLNRSLHIGNVASSPGAGFFCPTGDCGAAYDAGGFCGTLGCVAMNDRAESPLINCTGRTTITMRFIYLEAGDPGNDFMEVMYSANGGITWSSLGVPGVTPTTCGAGQGLWTAITFPLPVSANNNANVKIGFRWQNNDDGIGNDPSVAVDSVTLSVPVSANPVVTITPSSTTLCVSSTLTLTGSATNGPITAWSWSVNPSAGVTFIPNSTTQTVTTTFTTSGVYNFTLTATNGSGNGTSVQTVTVVPSVVPSISLTVVPTGTVCSGTSVCFTATPTNGGTTPVYQWQVNGVNTGTNSPTFCSTTLSNNDIVGVILTSNAQCVSPSTVTATYTAQVVPIVTPSVSISPSATICAGQTVNFTATPTNGGSSPSFQWAVNGVITGTNSPNFSSSTLTSGNVVTVTLTSNATCVNPATASNSITITVTSTVSPSVSIAPGATICAGQTVNFTATPTNGGTTPVYQWAVSGVNTGSNSPNFSSSTLTNGNVITLTMTSNAACVSPSVAVSNSITVVVTPTVAPSVTLSVNPGNPICAGSNVCFTVTSTNGGSTPTFQWQVNSVNTGSNTPTFCSNTLNNNDIVSVMLTSNAVCATPSTATSTYTIQVSAPVTPSVVITPNPPTACVGGNITFTAAPSNGGSTPVYQWQVNGVNAGTNSSNFTLSPAVAGDIVHVTMTSNAGCVSTNTAISNSETVTISPAPTLTVVQGNTVVCPNSPDQIIIGGPTGTSYTWSPSAGLNATNSNTVIATQSGLGNYTYYVTATLNGCSVRDSVILTVSSFIVATAGPPRTICAGQTAQLSVTGGTKWLWQPAVSVNCDTCQNPIASPTVTTIYTVVVSAGTCTAVATETVNVNPSAQAIFTTTVLTHGIPETVGLTNSSTGASNFYWTFGDSITSVLQTPPPHIYNAPGTYPIVLIAYASNGCNDTTKVIIQVTDTVGILMPNIFTPNGDNINEVFAPSVHGINFLICTIYDRWGIQVYNFAGPQDYWDGYTTGGLPCGDGTYFYVLKATDINGKSYNLKGYITLIR